VVAGSGGAARLQQSQRVLRHWSQAAAAFRTEAAVSLQL
jgi:hypothetical protein